LCCNALANNLANLAKVAARLYSCGFSLGKVDLTLPRELARFGKVETKVTKSFVFIHAGFGKVGRVDAFFSQKKVFV